MYQVLADEGAPSPTTFGLSLLLYDVGTQRPYWLVAGGLELNQPVLSWTLIVFTSYSDMK
jgi:hypothetical protein